MIISYVENINVIFSIKLSLYFLSQINFNHSMIYIVKIIYSIYKQIFTYNMWYSFKINYGIRFFDILFFYSNLENNLIIIFEYDVILMLFTIKRRIC